MREALEAIEPHRSMESGITPWDADELAQLLEYGLRAEGIRLHDSEKCIRLPSVERYGRPLTADVVRAHGIDPAIYGFEGG